MATPFNDSGCFSIQEFRNRGITKLAPDVLVYISGNLTESVIAPVSGTSGKLDFNDGISTVNVQNNVDPPGSSTASIEVVTPIYGPDSKYWVKFEDPHTGNIRRMPFFVPMMEIQVYYKGRYMIRMGEGDYRPRYYPAFWGFITNVEENYSGGVWKVNLNCADMLHLWSYSQVNVHPTVESKVIGGSGLDITHFSTIFKDANPYEIIYALSELMDMHRFVIPTWLGTSTPQGKVYPSATFQAYANGIIQYWRNRFGNLGNLLKMYGTLGEQIEVLVNGKEFRTVQRTDTSRAGSTISEAQAASKNSKMKNIGVDNLYLKNFQVFFDYDKMADFSEAEYKSKLEIATEVKNRVDFEFFQDVNGNWIFKPPFYNMNTKTAYPYVIKPQDIINSSFALDTDGITTALEIQMPITTNFKEGPIPRMGFHMDVDLAARYGIRFKRENLQYMVKDNINVGNLVAAAYMSLYNAKATTGSVTMPGRPELRLGYPVYIEHKDAFYYVKSINHSFDYAGSFNTTLSLEAERARAHNIEDDTWVGPLKDRIYLYQGPAAITTLPGDISENSEKSRQLKESTGKISSVKQGRYEIVKRTKPDQIALTNESIPFTDEEGYRVIGAFTYGRGILVSGSTTMDTPEVSRFVANPQELERARNNGIVVNAKPASELEADEMTKIFNDMNKEDVKTSEPVESIVPRYLTKFDISDGKNPNQSSSSQSAASLENERIVNMEPGPNSRKPNAQSVSNTR